MKSSGAGRRCERDPSVLRLILILFGGSSHVRNIMQSNQPGADFQLIWEYWQQLIKCVLEISMSIDLVWNLIME